MYSDVTVLSKVSTLKGKRPKKVNHIEMIVMNKAGEPAPDTGGVRMSSPTNSGDARTLDELKSVSFAPSSSIAVSDLESRTVRSEISSSWLATTTEGY